MFRIVSPSPTPFAYHVWMSGESKPSIAFLDRVDPDRVVAVWADDTTDKTLTEARTMIRDERYELARATILERHGRDIGKLMDYAESPEALKRDAISLMCDEGALPPYTEARLIMLAIEVHGLPAPDDFPVVPDWRTAGTWVRQRLANLRGEDVALPA